MIFINQLREKIGIMFGNPETTPGGRALKFYSSVRLEIRRADTIKQGTDVVGMRAKVTVRQHPTIMAALETDIRTEAAKAISAAKPQTPKASELSPDDAEPAAASAASSRGCRT